MAGELELANPGTAKTLEANGSAINNNAISKADDATYSVFTDGGNWPHVKFVVSFTFSVAPTEGALIELRATPQNIDGTNDAQDAETTRAPYTIGYFEVNNVASPTTQYAEYVAEKVPWEAYYHLYNNGTGQTISAGWTLKAIPWTYLPGA